MNPLSFILGNWKLLGSGIAIVGAAIFVGNLYLTRGIAQGEAAEAIGRLNAERMTWQQAVNAQMALNAAARAEAEKSNKEKIDVRTKNQKYVADLFDGLAGAGVPIPACTAVPPTASSGIAESGVKGATTAAGILLDAHQRALDEFTSEVVKDYAKCSRIVEDCRAVAE